MDSASFSTTKINFLLMWFTTTTLTCLFAITFLILLSFERSANMSTHPYQLYSALPTNQFITTETVTQKDARAKIIEDFFNARQAPLANYGDTFVQAADKYSLDYRLLPAIAMQESNGGKKVIEESYNPFGFGIYGEKVTRFSSWEEGINQVAKTLREKYLNQGLLTPYEIMTKYTPPSVEKGGPWAIGVSAFMESLK